MAYTSQKNELKVKHPLGHYSFKNYKYSNEFIKGLGMFLPKIGNEKVSKGEKEVFDIFAKAF